MGDRLTLRRATIGPTVGIIAGVAVIFFFSFLSLLALIRSYVEAPKTPAPRRLELALADTGAALAAAPRAIVTASAAAASVGMAPAPEEPMPVWAPASPPTWLSSVDPRVNQAANAARPLPAAAPPDEALPPDAPPPLRVVPLPRPRPVASARAR